MALPPYCAHCGKDIRAEGKHFWISFQPTANTHSIESKNREGMPGPVYTDRGGYFCKKHKVIEKYAHLTMAEALIKFRADDSWIFKLFGLFRFK